MCVRLQKQCACDAAEQVPAQTIQTGVETQMYKTILTIEEQCLLALLEQKLAVQEAFSRGAAAQKMTTPETGMQNAAVRVNSISETDAQKSAMGMLRALSPAKQEAVFAMAKQHAVLSFLYDELAENEALQQPLREQWIRSCRQTVLQSFRLLFLTKYAVQLLEKEGILVVVLKGAAAAASYPQPELRKSGDIDLLVPDAQEWERACVLLEKDGFVKAEEQHANHHLVLRSPEGIEIEVHSAFSEPFDNVKMNQYMEKVMTASAQHVVHREIMGVPLPVLARPWHAYQLLLHMLQHFLRSGFGVKLLCDWVVLWQEDWTEEERETLHRLVRNSRIEGFAEMITSLCVICLGLPPECAPFAGRSVIETERFMKEILEAEEFGRSGVSRMVVMRGTGLADYIREFHHQTRLTYPKASRCILLWPVLWCMTFFGFLYRNHTLRNVATREIMEKAKRRSQLVEKLGLFQNK